MLLYFCNTIVYKHAAHRPSKNLGIQQETRVCFRRPWPTQFLVPPSKEDYFSPTHTHFYWHIMTCLLFIFECKSGWTRPPTPLRAAFRQTANIATEAPWPRLIKEAAYYGFLGVWTKARRHCLLRIGNSLKSEEEIMTAFQESDGYTGNQNELGEFSINNFF